MTNIQYNAENKISKNWLSQGASGKSTRLATLWFKILIAREIRWEDDRQAVEGYQRDHAKHPLRGHECFLIKAQFLPASNLREFRLTWLARPRTNRRNKTFSREVIIGRQIASREVHLYRRSSPRSTSEDLGSAVSFSRLTMLRLSVVPATKLYLSVRSPRPKKFDDRKNLDESRL